jgi:hypothetical protein
MKVGDMSLDVLPRSTGLSQAPMGFAGAKYL